MVTSKDVTGDSIAIRSIARREIGPPLHSPEVVAAPSAWPHQGTVTLLRRRDCEASKSNQKASDVIFC
jgi:hypothetical protein